MFRASKFAEIYMYLCKIDDSKPGRFSFRGFSDVFMDTVVRIKRRNYSHIMFYELYIEREYVNKCDIIG